MAINVFVSDNPRSGFVHVPKLDRYPTMSDPAGSNCRDPQKRLLSVVLRGGPRRFYQFKIIYVAAVTIKMDMSIANFFSNTFIANMALLLQIPINRIAITDVRAGSVIVDFDVSPAIAVANDTSTELLQIEELTQLTSNLSHAIIQGEGDSDSCRQCDLMPINTDLISFTVYLPQLALLSLSFRHFGHGTERHCTAGFCHTSNLRRTV